MNIINVIEIYYYIHTLYKNIKTGRAVCLYNSVAPLPSTLISFRMNQAKPDSYYLCNILTRRIEIKLFAYKLRHKYV